MTNADSKEEEAEFEVLPAVRNLNLPLGIRCMEVNVQEVDEAVRQFNKKAGDIASPSWKFPHVTLEKLDVNHVMNAFRTHSDMSDDQLYMELMELLIDRLYYAIMTSFEFVNGLEVLFVNAGLKPAIRKGSASAKKTDWDPLEIAKKALEDNTPKPFHTANIGMLVRQFSLKMVGLENIVLNNINQVKSARGGTSGRGDDKKPKDYFPVRHSETQTDKIMQDGCDSCFIAQKILQFVAEKIHQALRAFNETDSKISKARLELKKDCINITQRGALLRWMEALRDDCNSITNCANMLLDINVKNQEDVRSLKEQLELTDDHHQNKVRRIQESLDLLKVELRDVQENRSKMAKQKDLAVIKAVELEKMLQGKVKECEKLCQEREALQRSFSIAEELNLQIKCNSARSCQELEKCKKHLNTALEEKGRLVGQVRGLSEELAKAGQEIMRLQDASEKAAMLEAENIELRHEAKRLKAIVDKFEMERDETEKQLQDKDAKIQELEDDLVRTKSDIEVLTIYPDLNGPINAPTRPSGATCIETMEMQVKSNKIRIEILRAQSERLAMTVSKLRQHMKSKSKTDIHHQQDRVSGGREYSNSNSNRPRTHHFDGN